MKRTSEEPVGTNVADQVILKQKWWKIVCFPLVDVSNSLLFFLLMFLTFYLTAVAELNVALATTIITSIRVGGSFLEPYIGLKLDKITPRFGKIRTFMLLGYFVTASATVLIFFTTHQVPHSFRMIYFSIVFFIQCIGGMTLGLAGRAGFPLLTKDPGQRSAIFGFSSIFGTVVGGLFGVYMAQVAPRHGGLGNLSLFHELTTTFIVLSFMLLLISLWAISSSDVKKDEVTIANRQAVSFKTIFQILKRNRNLRMVVLSRASDTLARNISSNQIINVIIFAIIIGDLGVQGWVSGISIVPNLLAIAGGVFLIYKIGAKKGYLASCFLSLICNLSIILLLIFGEPTAIRFDNIGFMTIGFLALSIPITLVNILNNLFTGPMIPDIIDHQNFETNEFVPGIINSIDTTINGFVSAFYTMIVGWVIAAIGFADAPPDLDTPLTTSLFVVGLVMSYGIVIVSNLVSIWAMKRYSLTPEKMKHVQVELKKREEQLNIEPEVVPVETSA